MILPVLALAAVVSLGLAAFKVTAKRVDFAYLGWMFAATVVLTPALETLWR